MDEILVTEPDAMIVHDHSLAKSSRYNLEFGMNDLKNWVVLAGGFVREPEHGNWDELTSLPGPRRLLEALFSELAGVDVSPHKSDGQDVAAADEGVAVRHFTCGTDAVGYRQTETVVLESTSFPISVAVQTFGLPGLEVVWDFNLTYQGQFGHSGFEHRHLLARFENVGAKAQFQQIWLKTFGSIPEFAAGASGDSGADR